MMDRKYILGLFFLWFFINEAENTDVLGGLTERLSKYSIVNPQVIQRAARSINTSKLKEKFDDQISYSLNINDRKHILHLKKNTDFLHPKFFQYSSDSTSNSSHPWKHCYYHGEAEGYEKSLVAVSTCSGLRGVIVLGNETYALEPVPHSASNDHLLYLLKDVQSEPVTCGVVHDGATTPSHEPFEPGQSLTSLLRERRSLPQTSYVELVLVVDNMRYNFMKQNETAVRDEMVAMANLLDGYYKPLNIRIVLMGVEIFKDRNPFSVDGSPGDVLGSFVRWRKTSLLPKTRHDIGQLIVGRPRPYGDGVLGMAFVGAVCSIASSGGINVFGDDNLAFASTVVAHEMGHNMGMNHDPGRCRCDGGACIMAASASGSTTFSSCSEDEFERFIIRGGGTCLRNPPSPSDVVDKAECGNGRLDLGEECDCGKPEECNNRCCDANTCTFTAGAACAEGACCDNCQLLMLGTPCRTSANTCDLPEFCDGRSSFCPEDYYLMDGLSCENGAANCYEGRCQTYDYQCQQLFAPDPAKKADDICFRHANTMGNLFGNCGFTSNGDPIKCAVADAMCGKVQCTNVDLNNPPPGAQVSIYIVQGATCVNADFHLGSDVLDPGYVRPGSPCGKGKVCLDFHCVNASAIVPDLDCNAETTCNGRGVCNDQGNCHCNDGWAPPRCATAGRGGSINSGPATMDHSLRNGLLIFFLLVAPVVVLVVLAMLYIFRRQSFNPCVKRGRKSQNRNTTQQSNTNVQQPAPGPDRHHNPPPVTSPPDTDFRYGEMDYWSTAANDPAPQPPPRVQGPGVPRPIPPRQPPV